MDDEKKSLVGTRTLKFHTTEDERPREKATKHGFEALSNAELMAIVIGSGTPGESVVDLCQRILNDNDNKLSKIARSGVKGLVKYRGIGPVKAIELMAALELSRRYQSESLEDRQITSSQDAYEYLRHKLDYLEHEEIWILMLNRAKRVIGCKRMSVGGTTAAVGDIKMILRELIGQPCRRCDFGAQPPKRQQEIRQQRRKKSPQHHSRSKIDKSIEYNMLAHRQIGEYCINHAGTV